MNDNTNPKEPTMPAIITLNANDATAGVSEPHELLSAESIEITVNAEGETITLQRDDEVEYATMSALYSVAHARLKLAKALQERVSDAQRCADYFTRNAAVPMFVELNVSDEVTRFEVAKNHADFMLQLVYKLQHPRI